MTNEQGARKERIGTVVSDKMDKTAVVAVERFKRHRIYRKAVRLTQKYKVHDENNEARAGDIVRIVESRPLSREKRWRIAEIVQRTALASEERALVKQLGADAIAEQTAAPSRASEPQPAAEAGETAAPEPASRSEQ
jgi:small subunit ribosomal protein S17